MKERLLQFFFPAETDKWLSALRFGLGLEGLFYAWSLRSDWNLLFTASGNGLIGRDLTEAVLDVHSAFVPRLGWLVAVGSRLGLSEGTILTLAWGALFCAACCLVVGLFCRPAAIAAWFFHLCAARSGELFSYGLDNFTTIGLFYLMLSPLPDELSLDWQRKRSPKQSRWRLGFHRRVLQLHMCVIYFFGGITKSLGAGWWNGTSIWRAMTCPPFDVIPPHILVSFKFLLPVLGVSICLIETGYPLFIWIKQTRIIWLVCVLGMHLAIGLTMGLYLFSLIMIVLNIAAFAPDFNPAIEKNILWLSKFLRRQQVEVD